MDAPKENCPGCGALLNAAMDECPDCGLRLAPVLPEPLPEAPSCDGPLGGDEEEYPRGCDMQAPEATGSNGVLHCPKCGAQYQGRITQCTHCGVHLVRPPHASVEKSTHDWKSTAIASGVCAAVVGAASLYIAWRNATIEIPFDIHALSGGLEYWVPLVIVFAFIGMWVFFIRKIYRRRSIRRKYPHGFRCDGKTYIPLSRKATYTSEQILPEMDQADVRFIDELSLHYDSGSPGVVIYETGVPDIGVLTGGPEG